MAVKSLKHIKWEMFGKNEKSLHEKHKGKVYSRTGHEGPEGE